MNDTTQKRQSSMVETANIVGSGKFDVELDLATVAKDLDAIDGIKDAKHSRNSGNRLLVRFPDRDMLGILAPSGVYVFTGVSSHSELEYAKSQLLSALEELGIISSANPAPEEIIDPFEIQNIVCTAELEDYDELDLNQLAISLGLEKTEYEPEQFPGLVYRPDNSSCTILVFSSSKMVITGIDNEETAQKEVDRFRQRIDL